MYTNQQPHSSGGNYQQLPNTTTHSSFGASSLRHPSSYPRSSSAAGYQQPISPEFDSGNMQQHPPYNSPSMYGSDIQHQYTSSSQPPAAPIPPYQMPGQRSATDNMTYIAEQREMNRATAFRRVAQPMQSGSSRARTISLYPQPSISSRAPSTEYNYTQDPRFSPQNQPYPHPSYRAGAVSPPLASHPSPRPGPSRMNLSTLTQDPNSRRSPLTSQPLAHPVPRRDSSASSTSQPYQSRAVTIEPMETPSSSSNTSSAAQARPHVCEMCGLAFVRGHDLKRHKDTHTNSKPHVCDCGKSFSRKDALKRHVYLKSCRGEKTGSGYATSEE